MRTVKRSMLITDCEQGPQTYLVNAPINHAASVSAQSTHHTLFCVFYFALHNLLYWSASSLVAVQVSRTVPVLHAIHEACSTSFNHLLG